MPELRRSISSRWPQKLSGALAWTIGGCSFLMCVVHTPDWTSPISCKQRWWELHVGAIHESPLPSSDEACAAAGRQAFGGFLGWNMEPSPGRLFPTTRFVFRLEESPGMPRWRASAAAAPTAPNDASAMNFFRLIPPLPVDSLSATGPPSTTKLVPAGHTPGHVWDIGPEDDTPATGRRVAFRPRPGRCDESGRRPGVALAARPLATARGVSARARGCG